MTIPYLDKRLKKLKDELKCYYNSCVGSVKQYDNEVDFPLVGNSNFLYIDRTAGKRFYWFDNQYNEI